MIRGTFANVRVKNLMIPPDANGNRIEGGFTIKDGQQTTVYDAAMEYMAQGTPTIVLAGEEYGTGSSRDWAAKGTQLLGVKVVVARSYERIHRSNLVGMDVLPLQFLGNDSIQSLRLDGTETFDLTQYNDQVTFGEDGITATYYESQADITAENPIANPGSYSNSTPWEQEIWAVATSDFGCESISSFTRNLSTCKCKFVNSIFNSVFGEICPVGSEGICLNRIYTYFEIGIMDRFNDIWSGDIENLVATLMVLEIF